MLSRTDRARVRQGPDRSEACTGRPGHARIARTSGISEDHLMDKKAKTPKKPKQNKSKDGAAKGK